jgi:hypothetical protein
MDGQPNFKLLDDGTRYAYVDSTWLALERHGNQAGVIGPNGWLPVKSAEAIFHANKSAAASDQQRSSVSYAFVDDIPYRRHGRLIVGDKIVEAAPRLVVLVNLGKDIGPMLFHCNEEWNCLGTSGAGSVAAVKERRNSITPGSNPVGWTSIPASRTRSDSMMSKLDR